MAFRFLVVVRAFPSAIVGLLIILGLMLFFGVDPRTIMQGEPLGDETTFPDIRLPESRPEPTTVPGGENGAQIQRPQGTSEDDLKNFVAVVLGTTEDDTERRPRLATPGGSLEE